MCRSWGPLAWLYPSEVQPLETRSAGQSIATLVNLLFSFVIGQTYLSMLCSFQVMHGQGCCGTSRSCAYGSVWLDLLSWC